MEEDRIDAGHQAEATTRAADFIFLVLYPSSFPWLGLSHSASTSPLSHSTARHGFLIPNSILGARLGASTENIGAVGHHWVR